jgi:hypothetical protein
VKEGTDALAGELLPGEEVLWAGQPDPSVLFNSTDLFLVPFSILWGGFALFWEGTVLTSGRQGHGYPLFFALWGIPFVLVGIYFIVGRFFYKHRLKLTTHYAVTNKRVLIKSGLVRQGVRSLYIGSLPSIERSIRTNGTGSIIFGNAGPFSSWYANSGMEFLARGRGAVPLGFFDIRDCRRVYDIIVGQR